MKSQYNVLIIIYFATLIFTGCQTPQGNAGRIHGYPYPSSEANWIRNGEPIEFEGKLWYPADGIETLLDPEVHIVSEYRGVQVFVDKVDVRPYNRLYTKFGTNKFRYFKKQLDSND